MLSELLLHLETEKKFACSQGSFLMDGWSLFKACFEYLATVYNSLHGAKQHKTRSNIGRSFYVDFSVFASVVKPPCGVSGNNFLSFAECFEFIFKVFLQWFCGFLLYFVDLQQFQVKPPPGNVHQASGHRKQLRESIGIWSSKCSCSDALSSPEKWKASDTKKGDLTFLK